MEDTMDTIGCAYVPDIGRDSRDTPSGCSCTSAKPDPQEICMAPLCLCQCHRSRSVDYFPQWKELRKRLTFIRARMVILLHHRQFLHWRTYSNRMIQKYQDDMDLQATVAIFDIENKLSSRDPKGACAVFPRIEEILRDSRLDSRVTLTARYLVARARVLQLLGRNGEAQAVPNRNGEIRVVADRNGEIRVVADRNGEAQAVPDSNGKIPAVANRNGEAQAVPDRTGEVQASHLPDRDWEPYALQLLDRNGEVQAVELHVSSGNSEARTLYQQAVGLCELGQPDPFSHPYVLHIHSTVSLLHPHRNRASGLITLPDEST